MRSMRNLLRDFVQWHVVNPLDGLAREQIYQSIFAQQCVNWNVRNDFYPVGGAAGYSLLYLLVRILTENRVDSIVEFGSGQTTVLIDRFRAGAARHVAYEDDASWHAATAGKLSRCDYRLRPLEERLVDGVSCRTYAGIEPADFDLMLVDGPRGTPRFSRFGCVELISARTRGDFVIAFDDSGRPGEIETIEFVERTLARNGIACKRREFGARTQHTILASGRFEHVLYYF